MTLRILRTLGLGLLLVSGIGAARAETPPLDVTEVTLGMHQRVVLDQDVRRISVGNPQVLGVEVLSSRELLALGRAIGRTNVIVWYADGFTEDLRWAVVRDLTLLQQMLRDIHPSLRAESAPDRDAILLRGAVPDLRYSRLAQAAAEGYLQAGAGGSGRARREAVLPSAGTAAEGAGDGETGDGREQLAESVLERATSFLESRGPRSTAVINLIQVGELPATLEERVQAAILPLGGGDVSVRRIVRGEIRNDGQDTLVLEGEVEGQVELSRILIAASTVVTGRTANDIEVLANEAGALGSGGAAGGASASSGFGGGGGRGSSIGSGGIRANQIRANIARATAVSTAGGRILAFIRVRDLPQVRVQVRVFEVNRTRLKDWLPEVNAVKVDQGQALQPPLVPGEGGGTSPDFGGTSWQMATRILQGAASSQWQVVASDFAIDVFMALLENEGVARSLAQPTLTVLSGESATFNVGGAIPIDRTLTTAAGNQSFSDVFFQDFGITLAVRPLVGEDDMITMDVNPDISFPDAALTASLNATTGGTSTAAFETRTLSTNTRIADGDVLAIGGLLQQQQSIDSSYTPGLQQVPGVGWFGKSISRSQDETEVVFLVSPTIVRDQIQGIGLWAYPDASELLPPPVVPPEES